MLTGAAQQLQGYSGKGLGVKLGILSWASAHPQGNWHLTKAVHSPTQSWIKNSQKTHKDQKVAIRRQLKEGPDRVGTVVFGLFVQDRTQGLAYAKQAHTAH